MKKIYVVAAIILGLVVLVSVFSVGVNTKKSGKVYIALEGEGSVVALDTATRQIVSTIDLAEEREGARVQFMPHNVQVAPDNKVVWVAANVMSDDDHKSSGALPLMNMNLPETLDEVIAIDPLTDRIIKRIPIALDSHLAHVITTPDSKTVYVTLQGKGEVYKINAETSVIENKISLGAESGPHGFRISPDGGKIFIAEVAGKSFTILNTKDDTVTNYPTGSEVVQTAVTADGKYAFGSLYRTKGVLRYDIATQQIDTIALPSGAKGPVQLYTTPDSRYLYVADQGYYFGEPTSNIVYRIDIEKGVVDQTIPAGSAPHGVVVDGAGMFVYITNLLSNDLSVISVESGKEVARIPVGKMPNGVSVWSGPARKAGAPVAVSNAQIVSSVGTLVALDASYDFGIISMAKGKVSKNFTIKNTSASPVVVTKVFTSCMCTTATLITALGKSGPFGMAGHGGVTSAINKEIAADAEAAVEVTFDPNAHGPAGTGTIRRVVYVETRGSDKPLELTFEAEVVR